MRRIVYKGTYKQKRKKVFEQDGLRLWLGTQEGKRGELPKAILELKERRPGTSTSYDPFWSGIVTIQQGGAAVETTYLKQK